MFRSRRLWSKLRKVEKSKNLRLLKLYIGGLSNFRETKCKVSTTSGKLEFLWDELQLLCWHGYPFQHLPTSFDPENLLVFDMSYSCIKQIWSGSKCMDDDQEVSSGSSKMIV